ncbi:hypothetical protein [Streptomyces violascens]|uniref:hypothetical protein n=1 Tax=Streptomyces violascens TaxID=67381 RepID=UPI0016725EF4|nr:hypothetical protein [Streptomyces violascens]GGU30117.1 hypothetical protein GCM10010289_59420 [Streptomyces violascens]
MFFAAIGAVFFIAGLLLVTNIANAAERAFHLFAQLTPRVGTATPRTLRIVGGFWVPLGAFFLTVGILR